MSDSNKGLYQRQQSLKYLKRGFNTVEYEPDDESDGVVSDHKELEPDTLFLASIANSLLYIGDQLYEIARRNDNGNGAGAKTST